MQTYNTLYKDAQQLQNWLENINHHDTFSVLVQIFCGALDTPYLGEITEQIQKKYPSAIIIGTSTAGEILEGKMLEESIVISLSCFESTTLHSCHFISEDSHALGRDVAQSILREDTKAVIMFADGLKCNGEEILRGFREIADEKIIVAGGMAGDNTKLIKTFVLHANDVFEGGIVAVSLSSKKLTVHNSYNLSWQAIGRPMRITKANGNHIYEINNQPIIDIFRDYLGEEVASNLPESALEFPLIFDNDIRVARVLLGADKESIFLAGEIAEGTEVRFGVASATEFEEGIQTLFDTNYAKPTQSIFAYSCAARKAFLGKEVELELLPLSKIAPISGFFSYGEFYSSAKNCEMLNITTTLLGLSESTEIHSKTIQTEPRKKVSLSTTALMHLLEKTISDLEKESIEKQNTIASLNQYQKAMDAAYIISQTNAAYIISQTNLDGTITFVNELFCKASGYSQEELLGKPHNIVRHPDMSSEIYKELWSTIQAKKIWLGSIKNRHKNGTTYYVNATIFPLLDKDANIISYIGIRDDITEIKFQRERAHALLNAQESIVVLASFTNSKTEIKQFNQKFFDIFAYTNLEDFLSQHECICDLFVEQEGYLAAYSNEKSWLDVLLSEQESSHLVMMIDKNKKEMIFSLKAKEIHLESETFIISTFTDVTELERARVVALSAEKATSAFLATMSHELRTPLNAVIGFSDILMRKTNVSLESMQSYIEKINISGRHLLGLVNNILDFSKIESKKMELNKKIYNLENIINETVTLVETALEHKKIQLKKEGFASCEIFVDAQLFKQLLLNILSNAVKFTPEYKTITLRYKEEKNMQIISICDEGVGMNSEQLATIFEPFAQIKEHKNEAIQGTGLGLVISQKIAELHQGKIEVTSQPEKGSCFSIYIPKLKD